jgi:inner membrane transporter RhtA
MTTETQNTGGPGTGSRIVPVAALLGGIVSVQYGAALAKGLFSAVGPEGATTLRLIFGALILCVLMRPWRVRVSRAVLPSLIGYGVSVAVMNLLFYIALKTVPLGITVALEFTGPLLVATLQSHRKLDILWVVMAVAGILLLSPPSLSDHLATDHPIDPFGVACALGAGAAWAVYIIFAQRAGAELGHQTASIGMGIAAVLVLPVGVFHSWMALFQPSILVTAVAVGIFSSALPFTLEMVALTRMPARVYGIIAALDPAAGALMGLVMLHEALTFGQWAGIAVVMVAASGSALTMRAPKAMPEQVS